MPVSNRSGPFGNEIISYSLERVQKRPRDPQVLSQGLETVSTAKRSSITRRTASELLRDRRALRSRRTFPTSSKRLVRVNGILLMAISSV